MYPSVSSVMKTIPKEESFTVNRTFRMYPPKANRDRESYLFLNVTPSLSVQTMSARTPLESVRTIWAPIEPFPFSHV